MSKQSKRRKVAKLRSCIFDGKPWSIMPTAMTPIMDAVNAHSFDEIQASLSFGRDVESRMQIRNGIAVIPITGVLRDEADWMVRFGYASSYQLIERDFKSAIANPQIKGVLFYCDSPGGSAIGVKRLADVIFSSRDDKPVHAFVQGVCGSAAYYLAAACGRIDATADSLVGSIGTIYPHLEVAEALKEYGIGATVFTNADSPKKSHGNQYEKLSDEAKKTLQGFTDSYGSSFINDVARYRAITSEQVVESYGQGDAFRADIAIGRGMVDSIVEGFSESLESISGVSDETPVNETDDDETPVVTGSFFSRKDSEMKVSKKIRAQLFALDLIDSPDVSDEACKMALAAWFRGRVPEDELAILNGLREVKAGDGDDDDESSDDSEAGTDGRSDEADVESDSEDSSETDAESRLQNARKAEFSEARLADIRAAADLVNSAVGYQAVTATMVLDAVQSKKPVSKIAADWNKKLSEKESTVPTNRVRVTGEGSDRYAADIVDALLYRSNTQADMKLSDGAAALVNRPLWAVAGECLQLAGEQVDMYGSRELLAEDAMQMGSATRRQTFFSGNEDRRYIQAMGVPSARPADFPNILSSLANKFLDTIQLDDDYSYPEISALLPGGLNDFKPGLMINKGIVEELDEVQDAEAFKDLGLQEEVLSYIFLRRFGNRWGWTPVMIANDDMNAFAEGMIGLAEAWQVTQNRLVLDRFTTTETLLDGSALFADRANTGTGTNPATNDNIVTAGGAPSDAQWALMEVQYADIGGINTGRRVRGTLNTLLCPTGAVLQEARRTFMTYPVLGESKEAATTANVGLYRGQVRVIPESELRTNSAIIYYGLRNPTRLNTATVVRGYFNGFGTAGRRERWYDPTNKTTWVSLEGRIAVATKNWRYAVRNDGTGA